MKKIQFSVAVWLVTISQATACDICGCFMGITPYDNQSSVGIMHRYRIFHGHDGQRHQMFPQGAYPLPRPLNSDGAPHSHAPGTGSHQHDNNSGDFEAYRVLELRAKYFIHQRIELNAFVPYVMNTSRYEGSVTNLSGIGDVNLFAGYHLIRKIETTGRQHRLIAGGGVKLPTGDYYRKHPDGTRYAVLLQPGTGSADYFMYANYLTVHHNLGLNVNASYKLNGENYYREGIANSTATFANVFYRIPVSTDLLLIPSAQFFYEYTNGEMYAGELTHVHQMNNALLGPGLDVFYKNFSLNVACQLPVYEASTEHPASAGRIVVAVSYNVKQTKYVFKPKS